MEDGFANVDIYGDGGGDGAAEIFRSPTAKPELPCDPAKPSRKRGREAGEWADADQHGDGGASARGRSGRVR